MGRKGGAWPLTSFVMHKIIPRLLRGNFILLVVVIALSFSFGPAVTFAHPRRTDSSGCYTCRTNCPNWGLSYGEYHCHRSKGVPQPKEPIKSHLNKSGAGYTEPAPEYKTPAETKSAKNYKQSEKVRDGWFRRLLKVFGI
jgi:hypothetical protein